MTYPPPPYADATIGGWVAGEALIGTVWAYPGEASLRLGGYPPTVVITSGTVIPEAGLAFGASPVTLRIAPIVQVGEAGLTLGHTTAALKIDSTIVCSPAGLAFAVGPPDYVGIEHLIPDPECLELELEPAVCI